MSFEGRSPIRDVIRSVVLGATMVAPAALEACAGDQPPQTPTPQPLPDPTGSATTTTTPTASTTTTEPDEPIMTGPSQRPRGGDAGRMIPTRGFAGAVRRGS